MKSLPHEQIEVLESRIAPAGLVTASFTAGVLTLDGDVAANDVHVFNTGPNTYRIEGNATDIKLGTSTAAFQDITGKLTSVVINGQDGDDNFQLGNLSLKDLSFNGGADNDSLSLFNLTTKAGVNVDFSADGGGVTFDGTTVIGGDLTVTCGADGGNTTFIGTAATVKGAVHVVGGAGQDNFDFSPDAGTISKGFKFDAGDGFNSATFSGVAATIGKAATGNAIEFNGGVDANSFSVIGNSANIKGNVSFTGGDAVDSVTLSPANLKVDGTTTITAGAEADVIKVQPGIGTLKGAVNFNLGEGNFNSVEFTPGVSLSLGNSLTVTGGSSADSFSISGGPLVAIKGAVLLDLGGGSAGFGNSVDFNSTIVSLGSSLTVKGTSTSGLTLNADATILAVKGLVKVESGSDDAFIQFNSNQMSVGALELTTGDGLGLIQFFGSKLSIGGSATVTTGGGNDFVDFGYDTVAIKGSVLINTGDDSDAASFSADGSVKGDLTVDLGTGDDGSSSVDIRGVSGIAGNLKIGGKLTVTSATTDTGVLGNTETMSLTDVSVGKAIEINLGIVDSTVRINNLIAKDTFTLNTGAGADTVDIEQDVLFGPSIFTKAIAIDLGGDNDTFRAGFSSTGTSSFVKFLGGGAVDGGLGTDTRNDFLNTGTNVIGVAPTQSNFETVI
jgi:hypothetical protein